jgi:hypothetical protein
VIFLRKIIPYSHNLKAADDPKVNQLERSEMKSIIKFFVIGAVCYGVLW